MVVRFHHPQPIYFSVWRSLASAPGLGPGGPRFESLYRDHITAFRCIVDTARSFSFRVVSSVGRASALHAECRQFETVTTHHTMRL